MKPSLSISRVIFYAVVAEVFVIAIQFIYMAIYSNLIQPEAGFGFSSTYMNRAGFYIFQILGFVVFIIVCYWVFRKSEGFLLRNALVLFLSGGVVELLFYLLIQADYQGAFLYSILDKVIAIVFAALILMVSPTSTEKGLISRLLR